ncbi:hypothetical protein TURU_110080 [Turdus rufiventris]|nr:hypothetical protein TURU_110080 [Turdus rufiventris]
MSDPRLSEILVKLMAVPGLQMCKPRDFLLVGKSVTDERLTEGIPKVDVFDPMEAWHQQRGLQRYSVESDVAELRVEANPQSCGISFQS